MKMTWRNRYSWSQYRPTSTYGRSDVVIFYGIVDCNIFLTDLAQTIIQKVSFYTIF